MPIKMPSREEMLAGLRKKHQERQQDRRDPDEFRPPKTNQNDTFEFYFRVLPELHVDDKVKGGGTCDIGNDLWFYENGCHFHERKRYECPRLHAQQECELCTLGFDMMKDVDDSEARSRISRNYLSKSFYAINIYILPINKNPENLRGKVMWFNVPRQIFDKLEACINNDDVGDAEEPKAAGVFFHPLEGYTFKLVVKHKGGYNNYEESTFIPRSLGPLAKLEDNSANEPEIERILAERHILQRKFRACDIEKLSELVEKLTSNEQGAGAGADNQDEEIGNMKGAARAVSSPKSAPPKIAPIKPALAKPKQTVMFDNETGEAIEVEGTKVVAESEQEVETDDDNPVEEEQPEVEGQPVVQQPKPVQKSQPKPITVATKPLAAPKAAKTPASVMAGGEEDPDLQVILSAIKGSKKPAAQ